jgi:hypothetical protein
VRSRWLALAGLWLAGGAFAACSTDTFVGGDGAAADGGPDVVADAGQDAPIPDAGHADGSPSEASCVSNAPLPCDTCGQTCCVDTDGAACTTTCGQTADYQIKCVAQTCDAGTICCLANVASVDGCPPVVTGSSPLVTKCAGSCGGGSDRVVCTSSADCAGGACIRVELGINKSYGISVCAQ